MKYRTEHTTRARTLRVTSSVSEARSSERLSSHRVTVTASNWTARHPLGAAFAATTSHQVSVLETRRRCLAVATPNQRRRVQRRAPPPAHTQPSSTPIRAQRRAGKVREGHGKLWQSMEGHRRAWKGMEGHGRPWKATDGGEGGEIAYLLAEHLERGRMLLAHSLVILLSERSKPASV